MNSPYTVKMAAAAIFFSGLVLFGTRLFPFIAFSRKNPGAFIRFLEKYIPPVIMAVLIIYCFKDVPLRAAPFGIPHIAGAAITAVMHLLFRNSLASIFSGTAAFMILSRLMQCSCF